MHAFLNTVTSEVKLCDRLHNAHKIWLSEGGFRFDGFLIVLHNHSRHMKNNHTMQEIMFYGNKWHYVRNHNALTKDFLNPFAHDLVRGSRKSTMCINYYGHNAGMTEILR